MPTKSDRIRQLYDSTDMTVRQIAREIGVRYQFAYNVIRQVCDRRGVAVRRSPIQFGTPEAIAEAQKALKEKREREEAASLSESFAISLPAPTIKSSEIRAFLEMGFSAKEITEAFGINPSFVKNVQKLLAYKDKKRA